MHYKVTGTYIRYSKLGNKVVGKFMFHTADRTAAMAFADGSNIPVLPDCECDVDFKVGIPAHDGNIWIEANSQTLDHIAKAMLEVAADLRRPVVVARAAE